MKDLEYYLKLGVQGVYPLFFKEWISEINFNDLSDKNHCDKDLLEELFKELRSHTNTDKKKIALSAMTIQERQDLIISFFKEIDRLIQEGEYKFH